MSPGLLIIVLGVLVGLALVVVSARSSGAIWGRAALGTFGIVLAAAPVLMIVVFLTGQPEPREDDDTLAIGVRVDDGAAQVWLGPDCTDVMDLRIVLKRQGSPTTDILELRADEATAVTERFGLVDDAWPAGLQAREALEPDQLDLSQHHSLFVVEARGGAVLLEPVVADSAAHPGEFWFGDDHGWLSPADAERQFADGDLSTVCGEAPKGTHGG